MGIGFWIHDFTQFHVLIDIYIFILLIINIKKEAFFEKLGLC